MYCIFQTLMLSFLQLRTLDNPRTCGSSNFQPMFQLEVQVLVSGRTTIEHTAVARISQSCSRKFRCLSQGCAIAEHVDVARIRQRCSWKFRCLSQGFATQEHVCVAPIRHIHSISCLIKQCLNISTCCNFSSH